MDHIPGPDLTNNPTFIETNDRKIDIITVLKYPFVVVFGNFLSECECDHLIEIAQPRLKRSLTVDNETGGEEINNSRTSNGAFLTGVETQTYRRIEQRISDVLRWPLDKSEPIQVLRYSIGEQYKPHYDYFDPVYPGTSTILKRGGQRIATLLLYLQTPATGGGTMFPDIGLEVKPIRGTAVFFAYDTPHPDTKTLHGSVPVFSGEKYIATKWFRTDKFV